MNAPALAGERRRETDSGGHVYGGDGDGGRRDTDVGDSADGGGDGGGGD